jgi:hypothetical protein
VEAHWRFRSRTFAQVLFREARKRVSVTSRDEYGIESAWVPKNYWRHNV